MPTKTRAKRGGTRARKHPPRTGKKPPAPSPSTSPSASSGGSQSHRPSIALPHLLTVDEVAVLLRTTRRAVYTRIRRGSIPGVVRVSRRLLIDGAVLVDWLDKGRAVSLTTQGDQR